MAIDEGINEYSEWSCTCENLNMHTENDPSGCGCIPGQWSIKRWVSFSPDASLPKSPLKCLPPHQPPKKNLRLQPSLLSFLFLSFPANHLHSSVHPSSFWRPPPPPWARWSRPYTCHAAWLFRKEVPHSFKRWQLLQVAKKGLHYV